MEIQIETLGLKETQEAFKRIMTDSPGMDRRLRSAIRRILSEVVRRMSADAKAGLNMKSDPRQAYRAVRHSVYRRIFGGNVNIVSRGQGGSSFDWMTRPVRTGRGGNRWGRSERTRQISGYTGKDRGIVLRILNAGTPGRIITSYTDRTGSRHSIMSGTGNRGSISPRNWFAPKSMAEMERAAQQIDQIINDILKDEFK